MQCSSQVVKRAGCERNLAQSSARTTKIRAQFSVRTNRANDQNSVAIQHMNETRSGHNFVGDR